MYALPGGLITTTSRPVEQKPLAVAELCIIDIACCCFRIRAFIGIGVGAGANILSRFAVCSSLSAFH